MLRTGGLVLLLMLAVRPALGQSAPGQQQAKQLAPYPSIVSNQVQVLEAAGDSLWSGPLLTLYWEGQNRFEIADVPALTEQDNVVFSIAARPLRSRSLVWAGMAFDTGGGQAGAAGFLMSRNGGASFVERSTQLDEPGDTTISYGASTVSAEPITQQANSAPQDLAIGPDADTVWVAGLRSGLRWSADEGETWQRTVLPPDTSVETDPSTPTNVRVAPRENGRGSLNHLSYSVLVDESGTVWTGTSSGVNRSVAGSRTQDGSRGWRRFPTSDVNSGPPGNVVVALAEQPRPEARNPIWMASWAGQQQQEQRPQRFGVAVTPDGGNRFRQALIGERIYDLAARRTQVYAAGETGLFVSADQGTTWRSFETFPLESEEKVLPSDITTRAVSVTDAALWVGTNEGLLRLDRSKESQLLEGDPRWQLFRTKTPVNPEEPTEQVPDVSTYAYPNPFVPSRDELVRIAYELETARSVTVTIYDFGMNRVRTMTQQKPAGQQETVWRGNDDQGLRVPTGTYFYTVEFGGQTVDGKILVAN